MNDLELAARLATEAGTRLIEVRELMREADAEAIGEAGDAASQSLIAERLSLLRPDDAVLSEEMADEPTRPAADRVWIIDPLDGTREYSTRLPGGGWRDDWAVHVALWDRGVGDLVAGAVALPGRGVVLRSDSAPTSRSDRLADRPIRIAVSRSRPPAIISRIAERHEVQLVPMGSAGVKVISVVTGETDAYLHAGGQYEWDSAAPVAVARAAGLIATRLDGSPLQYNRADPWLPDLLVASRAAHPKLAELVAETLAEAERTTTT